MKADRQWAQCVGQAYCERMVDVPDPALVQLIEGWTQVDFDDDRAWLRNRLSRFSGPPGMTLAVLDEPTTPLDHYAIVLTVPLPNSNDPSQIFPVGRIAFSYAAAMRSAEALKEEVFELANALALHEVREWVRFDGKHVRPPHPPAEPVRAPGAHRAEKSRLRKLLHV